MMKNSCPAVKDRTGRSGGYSLVEIACGAAVLLLGLISMAGVMVSVSHQREQAAERRVVLASMQNLLEEIKATGPDVIATEFNQQSFEVAGSTWCSSNGTLISVSVNTGNPKLLSVTLTTQWPSGAKSGPLSAYMEIHHPSG